MRFKKKDENNSMFITTCALTKLSEETIKQFEFMFYKIEDFKNEFVHFIKNKIYNVINQTPELLEIQNKIDILHRTEGSVSKEKEKKNELRQLYCGRNKILKQQKELNGLSLINEFMKSADMHYKIWLHDDARNNACRDVIASYEKWLKGEGKTIHYQNYGNTNSIKSKRNFTLDGKKRSTMIQFEFYNEEMYIKIFDLSEDYLKDAEKHLKETGKVLTHKWKKIKVNINKKDIFQQELFKDTEYGESKLTRVWKNNGYKYRLQISLKKTSPKVEKIEYTHHKVALDSGTETIAVVRNDGLMYIEELSPDTPRYVDKIADIDRYLDNSSRVVNPDFYRENGTRISNKEAKEMGLVWRKSNRYIKAEKQSKTIYAKLARKRKKNNENTTKNIIILGDNFITEDNNFKAWGMKRCRMSKKAKELYDNGIRKNDYTKQKQDRASAQIPARIKHLCEQKRLLYNEITGLELSTLNHFTGEHNIFTSLRNRVITLDESLISEGNNLENFSKTFGTIEYNGKSYILQRDLYAASKMLFCYYKIEKVKTKGGKEKEIKRWYFDNIGYTEWFNKVFYPKQEKYILKLIKEKLNGKEVNGTILGI